jgi:hypothetical protein
MLLLFCAGVLLTVGGCRDESLREDLERREQQEREESGQRDDDDNDYIRVVADPETALATPNCIMTRPGETVAIPVAKAFAVWEQNQRLFEKKFSPRGYLGAVLVWTIPYNLVDGEQIEITDYENINKAEIQFKSKPGVYGNAVIALTVNGEIRWSWHLWVTDYNPGKESRPDNLAIGPHAVDGGKIYHYKNDVGDNIFMDRNLGANSADKTKGKETHGMYYQWGKKDPLPGFAPPNYIREHSFDVPPEYLKNNMAYAIEHPDEYIVAVGGVGDWYTYYIFDNIYDDNLWGGISKKKTIYDPCPEGWRVPHGALLGSQYTPWDIAEPENYFVSVNLDNYDCESPVLGFYPATGMIRENGEVYHRDIYAYIWTATPYFGQIGSYGALAHNIGWGGASLRGPSEAFNVRCVRYEEGKN